MVTNFDFTGNLDLLTIDQQDYSHCLPGIDHERFTDYAVGIYNYFGHGGFTRKTLANNGTVVYLHGVLDDSGTLRHYRYNIGNGLWQGMEVPAYDLDTAGALNYLFGQVFSSAAGHLVLDMAGMAPLVGEGFDFVNGVWYTYEGDIKNATISFASTIPFIYATASKNLGKVVNLANGTTVVVKFSEEATQRLVNVLKQLDLDAAQLKKLSDDLVDEGFAEAITRNPELVDSWKGIGDAAKRANPDIADAGKILRKDIKSLEAFAKFDADLISKVGQQRFDDFMTSLIKANPKCKTCGNAGSSLVGDLDDVLNDFHKVVTERAVKADGSLVDGFDDFLKEAGEQASKAKGAALTLKKMSKNWDELTQGGWSLNRFEGSIPDIETGHKLDALFKRTNPTTGATEFKSVEMKNWSSARSVSGSTYDQFKAYVTSGNGFEYLFSDGLSDAMKGNFQNVFKDASKATELFNANPSFFTSQNIANPTILNNLANQGQLLNHPTFMNFVR
ncbi:MAG: hypothetical protein ABJN84_02450 [Flavobacteriaceae bacterium]